MSKDDIEEMVFETQDVVTEVPISHIQTTVKNEKESDGSQPEGYHTPPDIQEIITESNDHQTLKKETRDLTSLRQGADDIKTLKKAPLDSLFNSKVDGSDIKTLKVEPYDPVLNPKVNSSSQQHLGTRSPRKRKLDDSGNVEQSGNVSKQKRNLRKETVGAKGDSIPETHRHKAKNLLLNPSKGKQKRILSPKNKADEVLLRQFGIIPSKVCLKKVENSVTCSGNSPAEILAETVNLPIEAPAKNKESSISPNVNVSKSVSKSPVPSDIKSVPETDDIKIVTEFSDDDDDVDMQIMKDPIKFNSLGDSKVSSTNKRGKQSDSDLLKAFGLTDLSVNLQREESLKASDVPGDFLKTDSKNLKQIQPDTTKSTKRPPKKSQRKIQRKKIVQTPQKEPELNLEKLSPDDIDKLLKQCGMGISVPVPAPENSNSNEKPEEKALPQSYSPKPSTSKGHGKLKRKRTARKSCPDSDLVEKFKLKESSVLVKCLSKIEISMLRNPHSSFGKSSWLAQKFDSDSDSDIEWSIPSPPILEEFIEDNISESRIDIEKKNNTSKWNEDLSKPVAIVERVKRERSPVKRKGRQMESTADEELMKKFGLKDLHVVVNKNEKSAIDSDKSRLKFEDHEHQASNLSRDEELKKKFGVTDLEIVVDNRIPFKGHTFSLGELQRGIDIAKSNIITETKGDESSETTKDNKIDLAVQKRQRKVVNKNVFKKKKDLAVQKKQRKVVNKTVFRKDRKTVQRDRRPIRMITQASAAKSSQDLKQKSIGQSEKISNVSNKVYGKSRKKEETPEKQTHETDELTKSTESHELHVEEGGRTNETNARPSETEKHEIKTYPGRNARLHSPNAKKIAIKSSKAKSALAAKRQILERQSSRKRRQDKEKSKHVNKLEDISVHSQDTTMSGVQICNLPKLSVRLPILSSDEIQKYSQCMPNNGSGKKENVNQLSETETGKHAATEIIDINETKLDMENSETKPCEKDTVVSIDVERCEHTESVVDKENVDESTNKEDSEELKDGRESKHVTLSEKKSREESNILQETLECEQSNVELTEENTVSEGIGDEDCKLTQEKEYNKENVLKDNKGLAENFESVENTESDSADGIKENNGENADQTTENNTEDALKSICTKNREVKNDMNKDLTEESVMISDFKGSEVDIVFEKSEDDRKSTEHIDVDEHKSCEGIYLVSDKSEKFNRDNIDEDLGHENFTDESFEIIENDTANKNSENTDENTEFLDDNKVEDSDSLSKSLFSVNSDWSKSDFFSI